MWARASQLTMVVVLHATPKEPEMNNLSTLEFARSRMADGERRWLYGHPYRSEPRSARPLGRLRSRFAA